MTHCHHYRLLTQSEFLICEQQLPISNFDHLIERLKDSAFQPNSTKFQQPQTACSIFLLNFSEFKTSNVEFGQIPPKIVRKNMGCGILSNQNLLGVL
jgi:hypothetical protein